MKSERRQPKGTVLPDTCKIGDLFTLIDRSGLLATLYICLADNVWTALAGNDVTKSPAVGL